MAKSKPPKAEAKKKELLPAQLENPLKTMMPNYRTYEMSALEKASAALLAFLAGAVCSQVFYGGLFKSDGQATVMTYISAAVFILIVGAAAVKLFLPVRREQLRKKRQHELGVQFRDMLESITTSLSAGDTVYQAGAPQRPHAGDHAEGLCRPQRQRGYRELQQCVCRQLRCRRQHEGRDAADPRHHHGQDGDHG